MSDQHAPAFSVFETIRIELCGLAAPLLLDPKTLIPPELRQLPPMPEVKKRLWYLGQNGGGMAALAVALPTTRTWQWREMLEKDGPWTIRPCDLARICEHFEDPILYYLAGRELGTLFAELDAVPSSRHFSPILSWTLRRYLGEIELLTARHHEAVLTYNADAVSLQRERTRLRTETFVLLKQIEMHEDQYNEAPVS